MDLKTEYSMEQQQEKKIPEINPSINDDDDEKDVDEYSDENSSAAEMPPLETIEQEMNNSISSNSKKKNIIIPENNSNSDSDLEQSNDGYMDILNNNDLRKKIIKKGDSSIRPQRGSKVVIRLETRIYSGDEDEKDIGTGKLIEAETFERFTMNLGDNDLYQGLDLIIPLMELNEVCRAIIKPRFSYGEIGNTVIGIPKDTTLDCIIELLEICNQSNNVYGEDDEMAESICNKESLEERMKFGNYKKSRGNFWFERGEYSMAIQCYRGALKYLDANNEELKAVDQNKEVSGDNLNMNKELLEKIEDLIDKRAQTFNNLAAAQMKLEAFDSALLSVKDSLLLRPNNAKALFRRAKIFVEKGNIEEGIEDLKKASLIDPKSEAITLELDRLNKILAKQLKDQRELYRRMMQVKTDPKSTHTNNDTFSSINSQCDRKQRTIWSRLRWPAISLGVVIATAIAIQVLYSSSK